MLRFRSLRKIGPLKRTLIVPINPIWRMKRVTMAGSTFLQQRVLLLARSMLAFRQRRILRPQSPKLKTGLGALQRKLLGMHGSKAKGLMVRRLPSASLGRTASGSRAAGFPILKEETWRPHSNTQQLLMTNHLWRKSCWKSKELSMTTRRGGAWLCGGSSTCWSSTFW